MKGKIKDVPIYIEAVRVHLWILKEQIATMQTLKETLERELERFEKFERVDNEKEE